MGKRDLKKYLSELTHEQTAEQLLELYDKFPDVKTYYDFVFHPKEEKLIAEAKLKISNEYFPTKSRRAKLRRSTAQKYVKHFLMLGMEASALADLMLYNIEVAQKYSAKREMRYASFYSSMLKSFEQAADYISSNGLFGLFADRLNVISQESKRQRWENSYGFEHIIEDLER